MGKCATIRVGDIYNGLAFIWVDLDVGSERNGRAVGEKDDEGIDGGSCKKSTNSGVVDIRFVVVMDQNSYGEELLHSC